MFLNVLFGAIYTDCAVFLRCSSKQINAYLLTYLITERFMLLALCTTKGFKKSFCHGRNSFSFQFICEILLCNIIDNRYMIATHMKEQREHNEAKDLMAEIHFRKYTNEVLHFIHHVTQVQISTCVRFG